MHTDITQRLIKQANVTQRLIKQAEAKGINTDEIIYSICIGDIIKRIADVYHEEALTFSDEKLDAFIEKGIRGTEHLHWSEMIEAALLEL